MHDAVRNKYDLVMSFGKERGPFQNRLFRLRDLPEPLSPVRWRTGLHRISSPGHFWPESHIPIRGLHGTWLLWTRSQGVVAPLWLSETLDGITVR